jgi:4-hydroxy-tetrahydrodipicolinate reductase
MKLALIGYGKMGRAVEAFAISCGHEIVARVDPDADGDVLRSLEKAPLAEADVCIEFTRPSVAADNLLALAAMGRRVICGTTGWNNRLDEVTTAFEKHEGAALLHGANFSVSVNLFFRLIDRAAELFGDLPNRDLFVFEAHHRGKLDAPSGTARRLGEIILACSPLKHKMACHTGDGGIEADQLQVSSVRSGWIPGSHRVGIESPFDSIVIEHQARSREGFAEGAVHGAKWLAAAAPGVYRFEDVLDEILAGG